MKEEELDEFSRAFLGLCDEDGNVRGMRTDRYPEWRVPTDIRLVADTLVWSTTDRENARLVRPGPSMLAGFLRLEDADGAAILKFAQNWGVLAMCRNHRHDATENCPIYDNYWRTLPLPRPSPPRPLEAAETLDVWRAWARGARMAMALASALREREITPAQRAQCQAAIAASINVWFDQAAVRPIFLWERSPEVVLTNVQWLEFEGLAAALALQLTSTIARADRIYVCTSCGRPYFRTGRLPKAGERNYCPEKSCRTTAARAHAVLSLRRRKNERSPKPMEDQP